MWARWSNLIHAATSLTDSPPVLIEITGHFSHVASRAVQAFEPPATRPWTLRKKLEQQQPGSSFHQLLTKKKTIQAMPGQDASIDTAKPWIVFELPPKWWDLLSIKALAVMDPAGKVFPFEEHAAFWSPGNKHKSDTFLDWLQNRCKSLLTLLVVRSCGHQFLGFIFNAKLKCTKQNFLWENSTVCIQVSIWSSPKDFPRSSQTFWVCRNQCRRSRRICCAANLAVGNRNPPEPWQPTARAVGSPALVLTIARVGIRTGICRNVSETTAKCLMSGEFGFPAKIITRVKPVPLRKIPSKSINIVPKWEIHLARRLGFCKKNDM